MSILINLCFVLPFNRTENIVFALPSFVGVLKIPLLLLFLFLYEVSVTSVWKTVSGWLVRAR